MYLLDTNVISERLRPTPDSNVIQWLEKNDIEEYYLSVLTLGEIRKGIEINPDERKKLRYLSWLEYSLPEQFGGRILTLDARIADRWGCMMAPLKGHIHMVDSLIAATAIAHDLCVVTRNVKDFSKFPVDLIDPWKLNQ
jgi:toxin FitB